MDAENRITRLLLLYGEGDRSAFDDLYPLLLNELRQIAHLHLKRERGAHTLNTTALVNEAYMKLVDVNRVAWRDRAHFLAMAARAMRRILIDYARRHSALRRGGGERRPVSLNEIEIAVDEQAETLITLDSALERLAALNTRLAQVVECRFFGGLTEEETAVALSITDRTVRRDWVKARAWLQHELHTGIAE